MVRYNTVIAKLPDSQLNKLKPAVKNNQGTSLRISVKIFTPNNLPHELFLTTRQITKLRNAIEHNISTDIKLIRTQISKIIQSGGFLGSLLGKLAGTLMTAPLAKNVLTPLGITAAASAIDGAIQKRIQGSGTTSLVISNKEMDNIMKIIEALQDLNIFLKGVTETIKNQTKEQKGVFLSMLLGTLGASLLGNILTGK